MLVILSLNSIPPTKIAMSLLNTYMHTYALVHGYTLYMLYIYADPLTISDLLLVNTYLIDVAQPMEFGRALGLRPLFLEKIRSCYYHSMDCCLTEVLAAWLDGVDRAHDSPDPNWKEIVAALKSLGMTHLSHQLVHKVKGM